jgi:hypothetical protein
MLVLVPPPEASFDRDVITYISAYALLQVTHRIQSEVYFEILDWFTKWLDTLTVL